MYGNQYAGFGISPPVQFSAGPPQTGPRSVIANGMLSSYMQTFLTSGGNEHQNIISADAARTLFVKSGLPQQTLAQVWALANIAPAGTIPGLTFPEFCVAMHLIKSCLAGQPLPAMLPDNVKAEIFNNVQRCQMSMAAQGVGSSGSSNAMAMAAVLGIPTGQHAKASPAPAVPARNSALGLSFSPATTLSQPRSPVTPNPPKSNISRSNSITSLSSNRAWAVTDEEKQRYDQIFKAWDLMNTGYISGQKAREIFGQSGLAENILAHIWRLADTHDLGKLNADEFAVAMHLIYKKLRGEDLPSRLPPELIPPSQRDFDESVNVLKDVIVNDMIQKQRDELRRSSSNLDNFATSSNYSRSRRASNESFRSRESLPEKDPDEERKRNLLKEIEKRKTEIDNEKKISEKKRQEVEELKNRVEKLKRTVKDDFESVDRLENEKQIMQSRNHDGRSSQADETELLSKDIQKLVDSLSRSVDELSKLKRDRIDKKFSKSQSETKTVTASKAGVDLSSLLGSTTDPKIAAMLASRMAALGMGGPTTPTTDSKDDQERARQSEYKQVEDEHARLMDQIRRERESLQTLLRSMKNSEPYGSTLNSTFAMDVKWESGGIGVCQQMKEFLGSLSRERQSKPEPLSPITDSSSPAHAIDTKPAAGISFIDFLNKAEKMSMQPLPTKEEPKKADVTSFSNKAVQPKISNEPTKPTAIELLKPSAQAPERVVPTKITTPTSTVVPRPTASPSSPSSNMASVLAQAQAAIAAAKNRTTLGSPTSASPTKPSSSPFTARPASVTTELTKQGEAVKATHPPPSDIPSPPPIPPPAVPQPPATVPTPSGVSEPLSVAHTAQQAPTSTFSTTTTQSKSYNPFGSTAVPKQTLAPTATSKVNTTSNNDKQLALSDNDDDWATGSEAEEFKTSVPTQVPRPVSELEAHKDEIASAARAAREKAKMFEAVAATSNVKSKADLPRSRSGNIASSWNKTEENNRTSEPIKATPAGEKSTLDPASLGISSKIKELQSKVAPTIGGSMPSKHQTHTEGKPAAPTVGATIYAPPATVSANVMAPSNMSDSNGKSEQTNIASEPTNIAQEVSASRQSSQSSIDAIPLYFVKAEYDFEKTRDDDLAFIVDDVIEVIQEQGDWAFGRIHHNRAVHGWFPRNYCVKIDEPNATVNPADIFAPVQGQVSQQARPSDASIFAPLVHEPVAHKVKPRAEVLYDFDAEQPDELSVKAGEVVYIVDKPEQNWWLVGRLEPNSEQQGLVPANYLKEVEEETHGRGRSGHDDETDGNGDRSRPNGERDNYRKSQGNVGGDKFRANLEAMFGGSAPSVDGQPRNELADSRDNLSVSASMSLQTWANSVNPSNVETLSKEERKRQEAIFELVLTEHKYVNSLQVLAEVFYNPMQKFLKPNDFKTIFSNIEELLMCNTIILSDLEEVQKKDKFVVQCIGDVIVRHAPSLACYQDFCGKQLEASKLLQSRRQEDKNLATFLKQQMLNPRCRNLDLSSFLLEPMQRITRYPLLLRQIVHYTPNNHPDHVAILQALELVENAVERVNEAAREAENTAKITEILKTVDFDELEEKLDLRAPTRVVGKRQFIYEGTLIKAKSGKKLTGFLFNDLLLLTQRHPLSSKGVPLQVYRKPLPLNEIVAREVPAQAQERKTLVIDETCLQIVHGPDVITFRTLSTSEKRKWLNHLDTACTYYVNVEKKLQGRVESKGIVTLAPIGTLQVILHEGQNLAVGDISTKLEIFAVVQLNRQQQKTRMVKDSASPRWLQSMMFSVASLDEVLKIDVYNYGRYSQDEYLGQAQIALDFLEYYKKETEKITLKLNDVPSGNVVVQLQYKAAT